MPQSTRVSRHGFKAILARQRGVPPETGPSFGIWSPNRRRDEEVLSHPTRPPAGAYRFAPDPIAASPTLQDQRDWWLDPAVHQAKRESSMPDRAENDFAIVRAVARVVPLRAVNAKKARAQQPLAMANRVEVRPCRTEPKPTVAEKALTRC
jgi:hypothetical protein